MNRLLVDFELLEDSKSTLGSLKKQFDDLPHAVGDVDWGRRCIHDAMHTFGTNWDYHRDVLSDKIKENGEKIGSSLEAFRKADRKLYNELLKQSKSDGHQKHQGAA